MDSSQLNDIYLSRKAQFEKLLQRQSKILNYLSILRLFSVLAAIYFIILYVKTGIPALLVLAILLIILFLALVGLHKNNTDKKILLHELFKINKEELEALNNNYSSFQNGSEFADPDHPWSYDLDLFGEKSIFQYLNRTATHKGPVKLSGYLTTPVTDKQEISKRQQMNRELAGKINLRQHFAAYARLMQKNEDEFEEVISWIEKPVFIQNYRWTRPVAFLMSFISISIIASGIFIPENFKMLIPVAITNLLLLSPFFNRTNKYQTVISRKHHFLETYKELQKIVASEEYTNPELVHFREECLKGMKAIKQLSSLLNLFDQRLNLLVGFGLNALFLFDFHMLHRISSWKQKYNKSVRKWLDNLNDMDALFSLAGFTYNNPDYSYPNIDPEQHGIKAEALGHPMIPKSKRVNNSMIIKDEKVVLITGANMAGKSTFLRSVGINMALAYAGCPVCAKEFSTGPYILFSSMRTSDSLSDDESYFYAEIKRLKRIVERMIQGEKLIILLDEVLKGTNTTDKQKGSRGLIEKSVQHNVLCFIATHDLTLGNMEKEYPGKIVNYCFESYIKDLDLVFDYQVQRGVAKNMNASFLMRRMGIMD